MENRPVGRPISIVFLCLARDCATTLGVFFNYVEALRSSGVKCDVLIGENGSRDNTRAIIVSAGSRNVQLVDTSAMSAGATRLNRMAIGREILLHAARDLNLLDHNFVCVADLDNVMVRPPEVAAMLRSLTQLDSDETLFAISATSQPVYYDLLALRASGHDYTPLHTAIEEAKRKPLAYFQFHRDRIYRWQHEVTRQIPLRCESAFNGLCIYKASDYNLGSYLADSDLPVAEHVAFNASIGRRSGRQILISPELVLDTPGDHRPVNVFHFWLDRFRASAFWPSFL